MVHILDPQAGKPYPVSLCKSTGWSMPVEDATTKADCMTCIIARDERGGQ